MERTTPSDTSPGSSTSTTSTTVTVPETAEWPFVARELHGRALTVTPLQAAHVSALWPLLEDFENARLFKRVYLRPCKDAASFAAVMREHQGSSYGNVTYSIISNETAQPIGWTILHSFSTSPKSMEGALFLLPHQRSECVFEAMGSILTVLFEELGYEKAYFRRGVRVEDSIRAGEILGTSLIGILRRQMLVKEQSSDTDLYIMTKAMWPSAKVAVEGWLDSNPIVWHKG